MAKLYKTNGEIIEIRPINGKSFSYEELKRYVGGMVEVVPLPSGKLVVVNEEGKSEPGVCMADFPKNEAASEAWKKEYPIEKFPLNNDGLICGDSLVTEDSEIK